MLTALNSGPQVSALSALDKITADPRMKDSGLTVMFDSGIRTGVDVIKALSLGKSTISTSLSPVSSPNPPHWS